MNWLKKGHMQPPRDLSHSSATERNRARIECDAALQWAYDLLAASESNVNPADHDVELSALELARSSIRPMASGPDRTEPDAADPMFLALPTIDGFREWVHGPGATVASTAAASWEIKWLPPMALIDFFDVCKEHMQSSLSYSTFFRAYNETWRHRLRFRSKIMQSKCDDCERFRLLRKQATTPESVEAVRAEHLEHVKSTLRDCVVEERIQKAAYDAATTTAGVPPACSILNVDMGTAAKFKCPCAIGDAKMLSLWRPQQHMVCSICDGGQDHYWLVPPDIGKNANLSATLAADLLHQTASMLEQKGVPMPRCFRVNSDNAGGEVENQTFMKFMAYLAHNRFNSTEMTKFHPVHRHGRIDQMFTALGTALNKQTVLQTPNDFQRVMEATRGRSGSRPRVVQLGALYDWETYFAPLGVVQTLGSTEACHAFNFFRRDCMNNNSRAANPHTIFEEPPAGDDVILVTKHLLSSQEYAQEPVVFCPGSRFRALSAEGPGTISGRVQFITSLQKKFIKTADAVKKDMVKAQEWLTDLIASNRNGFSPTWVPPVISWVVSGEHMPQHAPPPPMSRALPPGTPVPVTVEDKSRRRICHKRPAGDMSVPAGQRKGTKASQRDQNLAVPSAVQSVVGAPLAMVNGAGPRVQPAVTVPVVQNSPEAMNVKPRKLTSQKSVSMKSKKPRKLTSQKSVSMKSKSPLGKADPEGMSARMRNQLLRMADEPSLGCSRCRFSTTNGCPTCKRRRDNWRILNPQKAAPTVELPNERDIDRAKTANECDIAFSV
jgi:hypothetical protein